MKARPKLSVCCMTGHPPVLVAASLSYLRPHADEIVVAVDTRVPVEELGPLVAVADRVLRFEFQPPVDRPRAWLMDQCQGEWILAIDGDEIPSPDLVAGLPEMLEARNVLQFVFPRRWLFPDPATWLAQVPWWPDFQIRLVRNDGTLVPRAGVHAGITPMMPRRHVEQPIYHLDCIFTTEAVRRAKAARYEAMAEQPGQRAYGGGLFNEVLYLPERCLERGLELAQVPVPDLAWIEHALAAVPTEAQAAGPESVPLVPPGEIDALVPTAAMPDDAYVVEMSLFERNVRMVPDEMRPMFLWVTNKGTAAWPWGFDQHPQVRVSYHWRTLDGAMVLFEGRRSPLPERIGPGQVALLAAVVEAPTRPGRYVLEFDLVHEHVRWFDQPLRIEVPVEERR